MTTFQMRVVASNRVDVDPDNTTLTLAPVGDGPTLLPSTWKVSQVLGEQYDVGSILQFTVEIAPAEPPAP